MKTRCPIKNFHLSPPRKQGDRGGRTPLLCRGSRRGQIRPRLSRCWTLFGRPSQMASNSLQLFSRGPPSSPPSPQVKGGVHGSASFRKGVHASLVSSSLRVLLFILLPQNYLRQQRNCCPVFFFFVPRAFIMFYVLYFSPFFKVLFIVQEVEKRLVS